MIENAARRGRQTKRPIEQIPAFRLHLEREGIDLAEFERRQSLTTANPDAETEALSLARRRANINRKGA